VRELAAAASLICEKFHKRGAVGVGGEENIGAGKLQKPNFKIQN
jgi:hypothetical protein